MSATSITIIENVKHHTRTQAGLIKKAAREDAEFFINAASLVGFCIGMLIVSMLVITFTPQSHAITITIAELAMFAFMGGTLFFGIDFFKEINKDVHR